MFPNLQTNMPPKKSFFQLLKYEVCFLIIVDDEFDCSVGLSV